MLERLSWKRLVLELLLCCLPAAILGLIFGYLPWFLLAAVTGLLIWQEPSEKQLLRTATKPQLQNSWMNLFNPCLNSNPPQQGLHSVLAETVMRF
mgnify:CR=1 FL=1